MKAASPQSKSLTSEQDFRLFLQEELLKRCKRNPGYSMRAFSKSLQVDYSTLSKILKGKRKVGARAVKTLAARLGLGPAQVESFLKQPKRKEGFDSDAYQQLMYDHFQVIADWYHYAILELMAVESFKPDSKWIGKSLGITVSEVNAALERLVRVGILEINGSDWIDHSQGRSTNIGPDMSAQAFRLLQKQILEKAIAALEEVPLENRDQTSMTMAIDKSKLPEARERIKKFRRSLARFLCRTGKRTDVYNLSLSLYPVSGGHERN